MLPPKFPAPLRATGSSAVIRRPLTLAHAASLRQPYYPDCSAQKRILQDHFPKFAKTGFQLFRLSVQGKLFVLISSSDIPIISYILIKRAAVCQGESRSMGLLCPKTACHSASYRLGCPKNAISLSMKTTPYPCAVEPCQCRLDETDGILLFAWPPARSPSARRVPQSLPVHRPSRSGRIGKSPVSTEK